MIQVIHRMFRQVPSRFKITLPDIYPMIGDCKIIDIITGEEIFVELKGAHCRIVGDTSPVIHHQQFCVFGSELRSLFCWKAQWDFLYTWPNLSPKWKHIVLFIPRDEVPRSWWNPENGRRSYREWPGSSEIVTKYSVDLTSPKKFVAGIERILHSRMQNGKSFKAQNPIPVAPLLHGEELHDNVDGTALESHADMVTTEEIVNGVANVDRVATEENVAPIASLARPEELEGSVAGAATNVTSQGLWSSSYRRGFGSSLHTHIKQGTCQAWPAEALMELCRKR